ncbi:hypothetical protein C1645_881082 [Glomus cerebriforme]|uniref:HTH myb-type domain-containing protein n=1 Tax=Glomus cerebriforme TaxID=658196 RepID=A0A397SDL5_9GLOM|nr:hypothetical protein C1645_881082 [Glomus cerebriforme]
MSYCKMSQSDENNIRYYMKIYGKQHNCFAIISRLMPKYTPRQISNYWRNYLDPKLCLDHCKKQFIIEWIHEYQKSTIKSQKKWFDYRRFEIGIHILASGQNCTDYLDLDWDNAKNLITKRPRNHRLSSDLIPWKWLVDDLNNHFNKWYSEGTFGIQDKKKQKSISRKAESPEIFLPSSNKSRPHNSQNDRISIESLLN